MKTHITLCVIVCLIAVNFAFSQTKTAKNAETVPITVIANLAVVDEKNNPVEGIKPDDIRIFENEVPQTIASLETREPEFDLALLIDNSGSMRENLNKLGDVRSQVAGLLTGNGEMFLIRFVNREKITVELNWSNDRTALETAIDDLYVEGGQTAVLDAVYLAAEKLAEGRSAGKGGRRSIILISDAEDRESFFNTRQTLEVLKKNGVQVFVLSFAESAPVKRKDARKLGALLALETGGTVYSLPRKFKGEEIPAALQAFVAELKSRYIIGYKPTNQTRDGLPRALRVEISNGPSGTKRIGVVRSSFMIPEAK